ncbi:hypothetical protein [Roseateles sp. P5_E8]
MIALMAAQAPHHETQHLALLGVQRVEEVGKGGDEARAGGAQRVELGVEHLLGRAAAELLFSEEAGQLRPADETLQRVALLLELVEPGGEAALLAVVQIQLGADSGQEEMGEAISMTAEMMAMVAVAKVMAKFVVGVPATKKVHGGAPWASGPVVGMAFIIPGTPAQSISARYRRVSFCIDPRP